MAKNASDRFNSNSEHNLSCSDDQRGQEHGHDRSVKFDQIDATTYLYADNHADGSFSERFIWQVNSLEQGGVQVNLPGLGTHLGMYFVANATGHATPDGLLFDTLDVDWMVDRGNNDGALSATTSGVGFAGSTAGDFALAHGSLVSAALSLNPVDQSRHADFVQTFSLTETGREAFGGTLHDGDMLRELLTTLPSALTVIPAPAGGNTTLINGGLAAIQLAPPGLMSLALDNLGHHGGW